MITFTAKETPLCHSSLCDINQDSTSNSSSNVERHTEHEPDQEQLSRHEENNSSESSIKVKMTEEQGNEEEEEEENDTPLQLEGQLQLIEKLVQFTSAQSIPQSEQDAIQRRVQRERVAEQINARRTYSKAHRSLVESLCHTALQRRRRAAQHIAQDPPADRLIGHNVLQYIPVGLLPPELKRKNVHQVLKTFKTYANKEFGADYKQEIQTEQQHQQHEEEEYVKLNWQMQEPELSQHRLRNYNNPLMHSRNDVVPIVFLTELEHDSLQQNTENASVKGKARPTQKLNKIANSNSRCREANVSVDETSIASSTHCSNKYNNQSTVMANVPLGKECNLLEPQESKKNNVAPQRRLCQSKTNEAHMNSNNNVIESSKHRSEDKNSVASEDFLTRRRLIANEGAYQKRMYTHNSLPKAQENECEKTRYDNVIDEAAENKLR